MSTFTVQFAVYGAIRSGNENKAQAVNVAHALQTELRANDGIVNINDHTMGGDPCAGNLKHFAAMVTVNGVDKYFACSEGQTIDFTHSIPPTREVSKEERILVAQN